MSEGDEREIEEGVLVHEYCTYPGRGRGALRSWFERMLLALSYLLY